MFALSSSAGLTQRAALEGRGVALPGTARGRLLPRLAARRPRGVAAEFSIGKLTSVPAKKTQATSTASSRAVQTRDKLSYMDEVLALWRLDDLEDTLDELEDTLLSVDFGPNTSRNIPDEIRERIELARRPPRVAAPKKAIVDILQGANGAGGYRPQPRRDVPLDPRRRPTEAKTTTVGSFHRSRPNPAPR